MESLRIFFPLDINVWWLPTQVDLWRTILVVGNYWLPWQPGFWFSPEFPWIPHYVWSRIAVNAYFWLTYFVCFDLNSCDLCYVMLIIGHKLTEHGISFWLLWYLPVAMVTENSLFFQIAKLRKTGHVWQPLSKKLSIFFFLKKSLLYRPSVVF